MAVTWVEKALASEMRAAVGAFFQSVYELPCADAKKLREEERAFVYKHQRMMLDLRHTKFDPSPTYTLLLAPRLRSTPPAACTTRASGWAPEAARRHYILTILIFLERFHGLICPWGGPVHWS